MVDEAVLQRLLRGEPAVAVEVGDDLLDRLAGVAGDQLRHLLLVPAEQLGLDRDVGLGAADTRGGLVHEDLAVRQRVALAALARRQQELAHRRGQPHGVGGHVARDELHRVEDGHARRDGAARRVDVERDVGRRVLRGEQQHLRGDPVGDVVVDLLAEHDDPLLQQPLVNRVRQRHRRGRTAPPHGRSDETVLGRHFTLPLARVCSVCTERDPTRREARHRPGRPPCSLWACAQASTVVSSDFSARRPRRALVGRRSGSSSPSSSAMSSAVPDASVTVAARTAAMSALLRRTSA